MSGAVDSLYARHALLAHGWERGVRLAWDARGDLVQADAQDGPRAGEALAGWVVPGMVNLHSHAFQRALGGRTETAGAGPDSFWTWREQMYRVAGAVSPAQMEAIAAQLYGELLRHGYTSVCEFHYLQRDPDGAMYARPAETAERLIGAARATGIGITMLPVLYSFGGFGGQALGPRQRRFRTSVDEVLRMMEALEPLRDAQTEVGAAPHSLRAAAIGQIVELAARVPAARPLHIHIAEQQAEVDQCLAAHGARPLRYLFEHAAIDARWCLVHATHLDQAETAALVASGAVAGLCPSTEANLGDGLFALAPYLDAGGAFGIGSDSQVSQSPVEELRWLEYGQRLLGQRRNVAASAAEPRVGQALWQGALRGGAQASGRAVGALAPGLRADLLVLDEGHPNLADATEDDVMGRLIFCGNDNLVKDVMVGGRWAVRDHRHVAQAAIAQRYQQALAQLRTSQ